MHMSGNLMNSTSWMYPFIILGGVLHTCGAAMNAQLFHGCSANDRRSVSDLKELKGTEQ